MAEQSGSSGERTFRVAVLGGDGIGPEVTAAAVAVLERLAGQMPQVTLAFTELAVGAAEYVRNKTSPLPEATVQAMRDHDAILLGAMGLPDVRWPGGLEMTPQIDIREIFDLYQGIRPIKLYNAAHSPLRRPEGIDFVIVRENVEGLFSSRKAPRDLAADQATDTMLITRKGAERICRCAFDLAMKRRKRVTLVDKANVLPSMAFFRAIFDEVAKEYPDVTTDHCYIDAMALFLVQRPADFDVLVTENMFGDILSDLGAGLIGGMGLAPSADIGDHAVFQPAHGTAPDIAGKGIANPIATILSAAMMLDHFGHPETVAAARKLEAAVEKVLADPANRTGDLGGKLGTQAITDLILAQL